MAGAHPDRGPAPGSDPWWVGFAPVVFVLLWSGGFPAGKVGIQSAGPMTFLAVRYLLVIAVMLPLLVILRPPLPKGAEWRRLAVVGALIQGLYFGFGYWSLALGISAGVAALISSLQPIATALLAPRLAGETVSRRAWAGLALGLAGAAVVIVAKSGVGGASPAALAAAFGALGMMTAGTFYEKRHGVSQHPVPANLVQHGVALAGLLPVAVFAEGFRIESRPSLWMSLAYLVIGNSVIAVGLLLAMVRRGRVSRVSALFFLVPPLAAVIAWVLLGERMPPAAWAGFALAAAGVALAAGGRLPGRRPAQSP
ncbi:MAG: DMT family transporter [Chloroflexota bacterium]